MFTLPASPRHRTYYHFALTGFLALSIGYLLRGQIHPAQDWLVLLLGVFPNLFGSFATPFLLALLLARRFPALDRLGGFALANLFTFAGALLIEYLHVAFQLGAWDPNDLFASLGGGLAALALFQIALAGRAAGSPNKETHE